MFAFWFCEDFLPQRIDFSVFKKGQAIVAVFEYRLNYIGGVVIPCEGGGVPFSSFNLAALLSVLCVSSPTTFDV